VNSPSIEMNDCCRAQPSEFGSALASFISVFLPSAVFLMIPKCPLCIAVYVAAGTGIGISVSTASGIRVSVAIVCICLFVLALAGSWWKLHRIAIGATSVTRRGRTL
jgi:hypothetical protein